MKTYQMIFILPTGSKSNQKAENIKEIIEKEHKGKVLKSDFLGKKDFAYPIKSKQSGDYWRFILQLAQPKVDQLKKELLQKELTLRFLLLVKEDKKKLAKNK